MYKENTICFRNKKFSTMDEFKNIIELEVPSGFFIDEFIDMLKNISIDWNNFFYCEALLHQRPLNYNCTDSREDGLALGHFGFNPEPYSPWFRIKDMLHCEMLLAELNLVEAIKYSPFSMPAITAISSYYMEDRGDTHALFSVYTDLINHYERKHSNSTNLKQSFFQITAKPLCDCADIHSNGGLRRSITRFLSNNEVFLENWGLFKTASARYRIPLYESYHYYIMYCYFHGDISFEKIINMNNQLIKECMSASPTKAISYRITTYKNNKIFRLQKLNLLARYHKHLTSAKYLHEFKAAFPSIVNPLEFINNLFFNIDFINKYLMSDWNDCYIFINHVLEAAIIMKEHSYGLQYFEKNMQNLASFIKTPFHAYTDIPSMAMLKDDLCKFDNNMNRIESDILSQLDHNSYYAKYYATTADCLLEEMDFINYILKHTSFLSKIFSESLY